MSRKIVVVKRSTHTRKPRFTFETGVPVNLKVKGSRTMMKRVTIMPLDDGSTDRVKVLTGERGRPSLVPVDRIERVRVL